MCHSDSPCAGTLAGFASPLGRRKRLARVKNLLKDLVTEEGPFVDEVRGVTAYVEPRFRKEYDAERLLATFPSLAGCVKPAVDAS